MNQIYAWKKQLLDGALLARKTGTGVVQRPVLAPLELRPGGKKDVIGFRQVQSESARGDERCGIVLMCKRGS